MKKYFGPFSNQTERNANVSVYYSYLIINAYKKRERERKKNRQKIEGKKKTFKNTGTIKHVKYTIFFEVTHRRRVLLVRVRNVT